MNPRRYLRILAPVILAVGLLAGTVGTAHADPTDAYGHHPGVPFTGGCYFTAGWTSYTPPDGIIAVSVPSGRTSCSNVWQWNMLCGVYGLPQTYVWLHGQITTLVNNTTTHQYAIGAPYGNGGITGQSCVPGAYILGAYFTVSTGPYTVACSNMNSSYYWFIQLRSDVDCRFF